MDPFVTWLEIQLRTHLASERGNGELIVAVLIVFLLWLLITGRRVVVQ